MDLSPFLKKLIVNADDFGLTAGAADGILKAHLEGIVTSATILINSPGIEENLAKLKQAPKLDLGLHLNVTWGKPLSEPGRIKTLMGENGFFIRRTQFDKVDPEEVKTEWLAQLNKARELGLNLSHLDTHHHAHRHPAFLDVIAEIAGGEKLAVRSQHDWIRDFLRKEGIRTTDRFIEDFYGEGKTSPEHLKNLLRFVPGGTVEVCCHPALVDEQLMKISSYNRPRARELATLTDSSLKDWLKKNEFVLSNFSSLPA